MKDAAPLTTPIFETTTFVFESAQEVRDYNEGRSKKFLYTRYGNPTLTAVEQKIAKLEQAEIAMLEGWLKSRPEAATKSPGTAHDH